MHFSDEGEGGAPEYAIFSTAWTCLFQLDSPSHSTEYDERNLFRWLLAGRTAVYTRRKILYAKIPAV
jgi:hypothetical protein